jgi:fibro-slime domain-containing protein
MRARRDGGGAAARRPEWLVALAIAAFTGTAGCGSSPSPQGGEQQHCYPNHSCNDGLVCLSDLCVRPTGGAGGAMGGRGGGAGGGAGTLGSAGSAGSTARSGSGGSVGGAAGSSGSGGTATGGGGSGGSGVAGGGGSGGSGVAGGGGATGGGGGATGGSGGATGGSGGATGGSGGATGGSAGTAGGAAGATGGAGGGAAGTGGASGTGGTGVDPANCGNGVLDPGEGCDDHNRNPGDGCSAICQVVADWVCPTVGAPCMLRAICGDGLLASREACDDANTANGDGCSADCSTIDPGYECRVPGRPCVPLCGDGKRIAGETCDDGNTANGDGCSAVCQIEPGATCTGATGGKSTCTPSICGNGVKEGNEACDCGTDNVTYPGGCNGPNGLFFGDGSGCSRTCTKEPICRDSSGKAQACATTCGNGAIETGEACDDGNTNAGDGCSAACTVETGFGCAAAAHDDAVDCTQPGNTGKCLELPIIYRDFQNESVSGGHPDFFYAGAAITGGPSITGVQGQAGATAFSKRYCIPNSSGPAKKNDATNRCWDMAQVNLGSNGKPTFNMSRTGAGGNPLFCDCQFIDWDSDGNGGHVPGYAFSNSPTSGLTYTDGGSGHPMYRGPAPVVTSATTFGQWWIDSAFSSNTHSVGTLEMKSIGGGRYQYSSQVNIVTGGFFPLDPPAHGFPLYQQALAGPGTPPQTVGAEPMQCNLWPYWYSSTSFGAGNNCKGDQYLFPPSLIPPDTIGTCPSGMNCNGKWYLNQQGWFHDFWFTEEVRSLFTFGGPFTLQFYGADDLFVYINGILVVDLGGIHQRLPGTISVDAAGFATIQEGGSLDATGTTLLPCAGGADPYTGVAFNLAAGTDGNGHSNCTISACDCRTRTVNLGLVVGRTYELAVFGANRQPVESDYQITLNGQTSRSACMPRCGDGLRTGGEQCDCGDANEPAPTDPLCGGLRNNDSTYGGCTTQCKYGPYCGDASVDPAREECDLGSSMNTAAYGSHSGCAAGCRFPHFCGDANVDTTEGEECDLGSQNGMAGWGCSATCKLTP